MPKQKEPRAAIDINLQNYAVKIFTCVQPGAKKCSAVSWQWCTFCFLRRCSISAMLTTGSLAGHSQMWLRTVWLSSCPDSRSYASAKGLSLCTLTWQYRRSACNWHTGCNTQLLITWVHRAPRIRHALWFSRKMSVPLFGFCICDLWNLTSLTDLIPQEFYGFVL